MTITQTLIDRFFENKCSPEEVAAVISYFKNNPGAVRSAFKKEEWDAIVQEGALPGNLSGEMLEHIKAELFSQPEAAPKTARIHYYKWIAAASVILILGVWFLQKKNSGTIDTVAQLKDTTTQQAVASTGTKEDWQTKFNSNKRPMKVLLQDGSKVTLSANSGIRYLTVFTGNKRDIYLDGEAFFEVAKDKTKPFIVYAGGLSTTALGTSFIVSDAKQKAGSIMVKLFTGKVVIKATKSLAGWKQDAFLTPGQQLTYNEAKGTVDIATFSIENKKDTIKPGPITGKGDEITFSHTALSEVLDRLTELEGIDIKYSKEELKGMNFTGSINRKDDTGVILKVIAQMNGLTITQLTNKSFVITKSSN
ncbi:FecR family protein [Ferruginibacter sp.]